MREIWVEAKGFPDYLVSNLGHVVYSYNKEPVRLRVRPRGRVEVNLRSEYGDFLMPVARLVASSFFDYSIEGMEVNHIDGDPSNNAIWNLEIVTREQNQEHAYEHGLVKRPIRIQNLDTGEIYESANEAGRKLGLLSNVCVPKGARENGDVFRSGGFRLKLV